PTDEITLTAGLPFGTMSFVGEHHPTDAVLASQAGSVVRWQLGSVPVGETRQFTLITQVAGNVTLNQSLTLGAAISVVQDADRSNNETTLTQVVDTLPSAPTNTTQPGKVSVRYTADVVSAFV